MKKYDVNPIFINVEQWPLKEHFGHKFPLVATVDGQMEPIKEGTVEEVIYRSKGGDIDSTVVEIFINGQWESYEFDSIYENMKNGDSHIIKYAKEWYNKGDLLSDMKVLYGHRNGVDPWHMQEADIISCLVDLCVSLKCFDGNNMTYRLLGFISRISPDYHNQWPYAKRNDYYFNEEVIRACLSMIEQVKIRDINFNKDGTKEEKVLVELDEVNEYILPLKKKEDELHAVGADLGGEL